MRPSRGADAQQLPTPLLPLVDCMRMYTSCCAATLPIGAPLLAPCPRICHHRAMIFTGSGSRAVGYPRRRSWPCERRACTGSRVDDWHITTLRLILIAQEQDRAQHAGNDGTGLHGLVAGLARGGIQSNARCLWGGGNDVCLFARLHAAHGQGGECNGNPNATSATASTQHLQKSLWKKSATAHTSRS